MTYTLCNGRTVKHTGFDFWSRPTFEYEAPSGTTYTLCIVDGKMHSTTPDGEPLSQLVEGLQLRDYDFHFQRGEFIAREEPRCATK